MVPGGDRPEVAVRQGVYTALFVLLVAAGLLFRLNWFGDRAFPINDGALFVAIAEAIRANGMMLPTEYDFNGHTLPFGYPPLALWLTAAIAEVTGADQILVATYYPLTMNMLFVLAFAGAMRAMRIPVPVILAAVAIFVFSDRTLKFLIMGGGITRGTGAVFTALALWSAVRLYAAPSAGRVVLTGALCGAAILSHLEFGITATTAIILVAAFASGAFLDRAKLLVAVGAVAFLTILPWLVWVVSAHGTEPFRSASATSGWCLGCSAISALDLKPFPWYIRILCVLGVIELFRQRRYFWVAFVAAIFILTPRHAATALVMPNSVLAAYGLFFLFRAATEGRGVLATATVGWNLKLLSSREGTVAFVTLMAATLTVGGATHNLRTIDGMETLAPESRRAMEWVAANMEPGSLFVVYSHEPWATDETAEWFPYLTGMRSLSTMQGLEWAGPGVMMEELRTLSLMTANWTCTAMLEGMEEAYPQARFIFDIRNRDCFDDPERFRVLYDVDDVRVFEILGRA